jgi:protein SCO1/2
MNKIVQISLLLLVAIIAIATIFYVGGKPNIQALKKSVAPAASLYPEAKSVSEKLNFINDKSIDTHLSEVSKGKWALLYFGYTSCPDVCPIDLSKINMTYQMMGNQEELQVVFISVDPMRDIGKLDQFASAFSPSFLGLTAHQKELMTISKSLGVYHEVVESQKLAQEDHSNHDSNGEHSSDSQMKDSGELMAHEMINPSDGDVQKVENHEKHMKLKALGYVHHGHDMGTDHDHSATKTAHYDIDHTSSYLLFNPELKLTALLTSPHEPKAMAKAIDTIIENLR